MIALFLLLLCVHVVHSFVFHLRGNSRATTNAAEHIGILTVQTLLFVSAVYFAFRMEVFNRELVSPVNIALGLLAGHLIFAVSLLFTRTHRSVSDASSYLFALAAVWRFGVDHPYILSRFIYVGVSEEIIWRAVAQPLLIETVNDGLGLDPRGGAGVLAAISLVAAGFTLVHEHILRNSLLVSAEFFAFALLLGVLYYLTGSLILVIVIHSVRDIEIAYLEFGIKVYEYGDQQRAEQELEQTYMPRVRRTHE